MSEAFSGRAPVTDLICLRSFLVCVLVNETSTSFPRIKLSPHSVVPLYNNLWTGGYVIGGMFSEIIPLLLISFMEAFSRSTCDVTSLGEGCFLILMSGVSILSLLTPASLILGWSNLRRPSFSLAFSVVRREMNLASYWVFPIFSIYQALSSRYVDLSVIQFFFHRWNSLMAFKFWWRRVLMSRESHHFLSVMSDIFVKVFSFIFLSLSIICMRRVTRRRRSWASSIVIEDYKLLIWRRRTLELAFDLALTRSLFFSSLIDRFR